MKDLDLGMLPVATHRRAQFLAMDTETENRLKEAEGVMDALARIGAKGVSRDDVIVRGARIINSKRDFYYSRFTPQAIDEVAELLPGRPLMVSHDYRQLPVGRWFRAKRVEDNDAKTPLKDRLWVDGLFFLPNDDEGKAIARRIDHGIYSEVSLGWRFCDASCSVCKKDIFSAACPHVPGEVYAGAGICEYGIEGITDVIEGSLVFSGGQKGTQTYIPVGERGSNGAVQELETRMTNARVSPIQRLELAQAWKRSRLTQASPDTRNAGLRSSIQSVVCSADVFTDQGAAATWVRQHNFRADRVEAKERNFNFRQFETDRCERGSLRTETLDPGVTAVVCRKSTGTRREAGNLDHFWSPEAR